MEQKKSPLFNLAVIVGALGYFVDVYDLLLFSIIRIPSLKGLGLTDAESETQRAGYPEHPDVSGC